MNHIIKQNSKVCRLHLTSDVDGVDRDFLDQFYTFDESAQWMLSVAGDVYQLSNKDTGLSMAIDFRSGNYRHRNQNMGKEPLLKAVRINSKLPETLIDATPGVLKDSFMLAHHGIHITAIERQPLLYTLVKRALTHVETPIDYHFGDATVLLSNFNAQVIYLDPMYPPKKKKSAQVKKDMQILHDIVGQDTDAHELLAAAQKRQARVVVKRPSYATPLSETPPTFSYAIDKRGATRFDIYLGNA